MNRSLQAMYMLAVLIGIAAPGHAYETATAADREAAERMLELAGGRAAWKDLRSIRVLAVNHFASIPTPVLFEIWIDFTRPRTLTRLGGQDINRLRAYLGDSGYGIKDEANGREVSRFDEQRLAAEHELWEGAFSRNLWRIAVEDPELVVRRNADGIVEFHNRGGGLVSWFELDETGRPLRFGFPGDRQAGLTLGEFRAYGPRRIPGEGRTADGTRFESIYLRGDTRPLDLPEEPPMTLESYDPVFDTR